MDEGCVIAGRSNLARRRPFQLQHQEGLIAHAARAMNHPVIVALIDSTTRKRTR